MAGLKVPNKIIIDWSNNSWPSKEFKNETCIYPQCSVLMNGDTEKVPPDGMKVYDNKPLCGFKIITDSRYGQTFDSTVTVLDPRGFVIRLNKSYLDDIYNNTTIINGEIIDECVWATIKSPRLISTSSDIYKSYTKTLSSPNIENIEVGTILSLYGINKKLLYLGEYYTVSKKYSRIINKKNKTFANQISFNTSSNKKILFFELDKKGNFEKLITKSLSSIKITDIHQLPDNTKSKPDIINFVNMHLQKNSCYGFQAITKNRNIKQELTLEEVMLIDVLKLYKYSGNNRMQSNHDYSLIVADDITKNQKREISLSNRDFMYYVFNTQTIGKNVPLKKIKIKHSPLINIENQSVVKKTNSYPPPIDNDIDDFNFYKVKSTLISEDNTIISEIYF